MNVTIRAWEMEDAFVLNQLSMHPFYTKDRILKYLYPDTYLNSVSMIHFYQQADKSRFLFRAILLDGKPCGFLQCEKKRRGAELSYWLDVDRWNQGIMSEAIALFCKEIFDTIDVISIYARIEQRNIASQKVLEHNGFQKKQLEYLFVYQLFK